MSIERYVDTVTLLAACVRLDIVLKGKALNYKLTSISKIENESQSKLAVNFSIRKVSIYSLLFAKIKEQITISRINDQIRFPLQSKKF